MMRIITPGAIFMEKNTLLPQPLRLDKEPQTWGWTAVWNNLDRHELEKALAIAGWTFFYMAGKIRTTAFGFQRQRMIHAALKRLIAHVKSKGATASKSTRCRPTRSSECHT